MVKGIQRIPKGIVIIILVLFDLVLFNRENRV